MPLKQYHPAFQVSTISNHSWLASPITKISVQKSLSILTAQATCYFQAQWLDCPTTESPSPTSWTEQRLRERCQTQLILLQRLQQDSPLLPEHYLQYMMDEWCSPYSSWLRTMKGCSCRTPTASALLPGILVEVSVCSACSSEHGSASAMLVSVFFSALWPWRKKSCVKYKEAAPYQAPQLPQPAGRKKKKEAATKQKHCQPNTPSTRDLSEHKDHVLHNCTI